MKKITIIIGAQGTGKTTKAINLAGENFKTNWQFIEFKSKKYGNEIQFQHDTSCIIMEELSGNLYILKLLLQHYAKAETFYTRLPYNREPKIYNYPNLIIVKNLENDKNIKKLINELNLSNVVDLINCNPF